VITVKMDPFMSKPTTQEEFMLMLHERIIALEAANEDLKTLVKRQAHEIQELKKNQEHIRFNLHLHEFSNGGFLEWDIRKEITEARIYYKDSGRRIQITDAYLDAALAVDGETLEGDEEYTFIVPVEKECHGALVLVKNRPLVEMTLRNLLQEMYDFYHREVREEELNKLYKKIQKHVRFSEEDSVEFVRDMYHNQTSEHKLRWIDVMTALYEDEEISYIGIQDQYEYIIEIAIE